MNKPQTLKELIDRIEIEISRKSLSDGYLHKKGHETRDEVGIGEYQHGIVMVPEDWVLPYLKRLLEIMEQR